jgi:hypothetical protein
MPRVPVPLTWKRRQFAVLQPLGTIGRLWAIPVNGLVAGPFAIHPSHYGGGYHVLIHLPSQTKIMDARLQMTAREAAAKFAACDVNWWTCIREEIIGPDSQELVNIYGHYHQLSSIESTRDWRKTPESRK